MVGCQLARFIRDLAAPARLAKETESLMSNPGPDREDFPLIGESPAMVAMRMELELAARSQAKVLISGETGAGKEVVARLIHHNGPRRSRRFVAT